ncbi:MAG: hypothetical protein IH591_09485 [Bacteroidales bacterium]|nr:hypothetical protein [Bacteroidales bacterium]
MKLTTEVPVVAAEETDGVERKLGTKLPVRKNVVSMNFAPYELKTVLLKLSSEPNPNSLTIPLVLEYDTDIFSYNSNREDGYIDRTPRSEGHRGSLDGKGGTYPAEMIGDKVQMGNVSFEIGPREEGKYNAVACKGQKIALPEGTQVLHILAAADVDTDVIFKSGGQEFPLSIGGWTGYMGLWDNREFEGFVAELSYSLRNDLKTIHPAFVRNQRIAWAASHHHRPAGDALYEYSYMFSYRIEIPVNATSITLPDSRFVRIVAMSVGDEGSATQLRDTFEELHRDESFIERFSNISSSESKR